MDFLDELTFNTAFQARLKDSRVSMHWSQPRMAAALGVKLDAYKKYEGRVGSAFPLYLLPKLALITDRPLSYWVGVKDSAQNRPHLRQVR